MKLFAKYNSVLRGLDSTEVPFLRNQMIELCCPRSVSPSADTRLDGIYFSFKTGGSPNDVVDRAQFKMRDDSHVDLEDFQNNVKSRDERIEELKAQISHLGDERARLEAEAEAERLRLEEELKRLKAARGDKS